MVDSKNLTKEELDRQGKAIKYAVDHVEDFGDEKWKRTGDTQSIGHLAYSCVNMAVVMNIIKIMEGEEVEPVKSSNIEKLKDIKS